VLLQRDPSYMETAGEARMPDAGALPSGKKSPAQ